MNTTAKTLIQALVAGVALAVIGATLINAATPAAPQKVVQLERVVITGKRLQAEPVQVAQLPQVIVTGKRSDAEPRLLAQLGRALSRIAKSV